MTEQKTNSPRGARNKLARLSKNFYAYFFLLALKMRHQQKTTLFFLLFNFRQQFDLNTLFSRVSLPISNTLNVTDKKRRSTNTSLRVVNKREDRHNSSSYKSQEKANNS